MKSFLQGKKVLPITPLRPPTGLAAALAARSCQSKLAPASHEQPTAPSSASVELIKEGDKVVRMIVTCSCGERVEIECLYPAGI